MIKIKINCYCYKTANISLDPDNVFIETQAVIHGTEKSTVIIPCKPTSKNVQVQLLKDDEEVILETVINHWKLFSLQILSTILSFF